MALLKAPLSSALKPRAKIIDFVPVKDKALLAYYKATVDTFSDGLNRGDYTIGYDTLASLMSVFYDRRSEIIAQLSKLDLTFNPELNTLKDALVFLKNGDINAATPQIAQMVSGAFSIIQSNSMSSEDGNLLCKTGDNLNEKIRESVAKLITHSQKSIAENVAGEHNVAKTGIALRDLALIHKTAHSVREDGANGFFIDTAITACLGKNLDKNALDIISVDGNTVGISPKIGTRHSVHFTLQAPVTNHVYGTFDGDHTIYGNLDATIRSNGITPETVLATDTAFVPDNGSLHIPNAVLLTRVDSLPDGQFMQQTGNKIQVCRAIDSDNITDAQRVLATLPDDYKKRFNGKSLSDPMVANALAHSVAMHAIGAPLIAGDTEASLDNGFIDLIGARELADLLGRKYQMYGVSVASHHGQTDTAKFDAALRKFDNTEMQKIADNSPKIRELCKNILNSPVFQQGKNDYIAEHLTLSDHTAGIKVFEKFSPSEIHSAVVSRPDIRQAYCDLAKNVYTDNRAELVVGILQQHEKDGIPPPSFDAVIRKLEDAKQQNQIKPAGVRL
jgi:hypothetical protein